MVLFCIQSTSRGDADKVLQELCSAGHEGIIAKRDDRYRSGRGKKAG
ncbi:hypothetical protein QW131_29600 [Roseibium salinum]|nr:hypothetical protein [Roseibium salinum]